MSVSVSSEVQYMTSRSQLSTRLVEVLSTDSHLLTGWVTNLLASWLTCPQHWLSWLAVRLTDTLVNSPSAADVVNMDSLGVIFSSSARIQESTKETNDKHLDVENKSTAILGFMTSTVCVLEAKMLRIDSKFNRN